MYSNLESRSEMKSLSRNVCQTSSGTADFRPVYLRLIDQRCALIRLIKSSSFSSFADRIGTFCSSWETQRKPSGSLPCFTSNSCFSELLNSKLLFLLSQ